LFRKLPGPPGRVPWPQGGARHRGARLRLVRHIVAAFACGDLLLMAVVLAYYFGVARVRVTSSKALSPAVACCSP